MQTQGKILDINGQEIGRCPADNNSVAVAFLVYPEAKSITTSKRLTRRCKAIRFLIADYRNRINIGETEEISEISQYIHVDENIARPA